MLEQWGQGALVGGKCLWDESRYCWGWYAVICRLKGKANNKFVLLHHELSPTRDTVVSVQQDTDKLDITLMVFFIQPDEEENDAEDMA